MITFHGPEGKIQIQDVGMYSDNTPLVKHSRWDEIVASSKMTVTARSLVEFTTAMFLADSVYWSGGWIDTLVIPYLPGARQDRINPGGDILFTARSVANMINERGFYNVVYVDAHSGIMPGYLNRPRPFPVRNVYEKLWKGYSGVIAPDAGAKNRAMIAHDVIGGDFIVASKTRDVSSGHITGYRVDSLESGKHYLVVDDICDGGRTFLTLAEEIRKAGAFADLFVMHGIFSHPTRKLRDAYKNIYTTDTLVPHFPAGINRIRILEEMENFV